MQVQGLEFIEIILCGNSSEFARVVWFFRPDVKHKTYGEFVKIVKRYANFKWTQKKKS